MGNVAALGAKHARGRVLVVSGLAAEARIAAGLGTQTFSFGGFAARLEAELVAALREGAAGVLSFGIAGGLVPGLAPGAVVLADRILSADETHSCDPFWLQRLADKLPRATRAAIFGAEKAIAHAPEKARLAERTGAVAVDMESHIAARCAAKHNAPFAAIRVVADPVGRSLPPAALVGMGADGRADIFAVRRSLTAKPRQLPSLLRTALDAKRAFDVLKICRRALDEDFCLFLPTAA